jgi:ubiquinone/menaquinone biosynthesis C-methylase UbiE
MSQLEFNEELAREMEVIYRQPDILRRRALVHEALAAQPGDRVLDAGCGPGFYVAEVLGRVGPDGSVVGVDASEPMLALSAKRCEGHPNVEFHQGDVTALPVGDAEFDRALSVQVLEYVADIPAALAELKRVLKPGGRLLIWDVDWATVSWHSEDPARMERFLRAWDEHLTHPALPRTLSASLRDAGFEDVEMQGHTFATDDVSEETYAGALVPMMAGFVGTDEAQAWMDEQRELHARGRSYFACIQFCFTATRAG